MRYTLWAQPGVNCAQRSCPEHGTPHRHPIKVAIGTYRKVLAEFGWRRRHPGHMHDFRIALHGTSYDEAVDATWLARWAPTAMPMERPDEPNAPVYQPAQVAS